MEDFESVLGEHLLSLQIFMKDVTNKMYDKIIHFFNITSSDKLFQLDQTYLKSIINNDIVDIYNNLSSKNIFIKFVDDKFLELITDKNKIFLYESVDVLIKIVLNIIKSFTKKIDDVTPDNLRTKIKNTIYANVISSTIINIEFADKTNVPGIKKIKELITKRLGKDIPQDLLNKDEKTDGVIFKHYQLPFYNLVILYFILDNITLKIPKYELYTFNTKI